MKIKKENKAFCVMPWVSFRSCIGDYYTICCYSNLIIKENNNQKNDSGKFWNSKEIMKLRRDMLNGVKSPYCDICWTKEKNKVKSDRQYFNEAFFLKIDDFLNKTDKDGFLSEKPIILDIGLGHSCDFSCRMCAVPKKRNKKIIASSPRKQKIMIEKAKVVNKKHFKENIFPFLDKIKYVNIAGGEPFVIKNNEYFLEECVRGGFSKNISLKIVTNFNKSPIKFLKLFSNFKKCQLDISIDGVGDLYEYIRYPGRWKKFKKNLKELSGCSKNIDICFAVTVQIYNVFDIEEILKFKDRFEKNLDKKIFLYLSCLYRPDFFSVKNLPDDLKKEAINVIKKASLEITDKEVLSNLDNLIKFINSERKRNVKEDFVEYTCFYDKTRNQSYDKIIDNRIVKWIKK